jgi:hypothetical protein
VNREIHSSLLMAKCKPTVMSLQRLSQQFRSHRVKGRTHNVAFLSVKRVGPFAGRLGFTGRVLVDRERVGYFVGCEPRTFDVDPGEHNITVFFGRRPAIFSSRGVAMSSVSVSLGPGERADFVCGVRSEVADLWAKARWAVAIHGAVFVFVLYLAAEAGSLLAPYLREIVALAVYHFPVNGSLISLSYRLASPLLCAFWFEIVAWWIICQSTHFPRDETDEELLSRIGSPYYLERLPSVEVATQ